MSSRRYSPLVEFTVDLIDGELVDARKVTLERKAIVPRGVETRRFISNENAMQVYYEELHCVSNDCIKFLDLDLYYFNCGHTEYAVRNFSTDDFAKKINACGCTVQTEDGNQGGEFSNDFDITNEFD